MQDVIRRLALACCVLLLFTSCVGETHEARTTRSGPGVVSVEIANLVASTDDHVAGVLMKRQDRDGYPWDGVAGFATLADSDPYSGVHVLGEVSEEWGDFDTGLWPWPSGVAEIPPGEYTLQLWVGKDFCCYSRWMPADTPGLRFCEVQVTITGGDQTIRVENIPHRPPLSGEPDYPCR